VKATAFEEVRPTFSVSKPLAEATGGSEAEKPRLRVATFVEGRVTPGLSLLIRRIDLLLLVFHSRSTGLDGYRIRKKFPNI